MDIFFFTLSLSLSFGSTNYTGVINVLTIFQMYREFNEISLIIYR